MWFAGNAVISDVFVNETTDHADLIFYLTSSVQFGFIVGTLVFALRSYTDKYSPSKVFLVSALLASVLNLSTTLVSGIYPFMLMRFATGFFIAGIYPVGMKIAADHFGKDVGRALGFLLGALVLGSAFPHFLKWIGSHYSWKMVFMSTSTLALIGGTLVNRFIPDGEHRVKGQRINIMAFSQAFKNKAFRGASLGYFGHMWELYTFWALVPFILKQNSAFVDSGLNVYLWSFLIIAIGAFGCLTSGIFSIRIGSAKPALVALTISGLCCLFSPWILSSDSLPLLLSVLFIWGYTVIADSPMFSSLVSLNVEPTIKGSALTMMNCIGFSLTIISIVVTDLVLDEYGFQYGLWVLAPGPILGVRALAINMKRIKA